MLLDFPGGSDYEESACNVLDPWVGKILWRREWQPIPVFLPGGFHKQRNLAGYRAPLIAQLVKNLPAMQETPVRFLGRKDPLEKEWATVHGVARESDPTEHEHIFLQGTIAPSSGRPGKSPQEPSVTPAHPALSVMSSIHPSPQPLSPLVQELIAICPNLSECLQLVSLPLPFVPSWVVPMLSQS